MNQVKYSVVIPTYNESEVIVDCIQAVKCAAKRLRSTEVEIIVVDDSKDETSDLAYIEGAIVIKPIVRGGRCEARNLGILNSHGEMVVILNADAYLPEDYFVQVHDLYCEGFQSITPFVKVRNIDDLYARFVECWTKFEDARGEYVNRIEACRGIYWSEGFCVEKKLALKAGLFPTGFVRDIVAGEDVRFVDRLRELNCRGKIAFDLVVEHTAPSTLKEFWITRVGRGRGTPQIRLFVDHWSPVKLMLFLTAKNAFRLLKLVTLVGPISYSYRVTFRLNLREDFLPFIWVNFVEELAYGYGELSELWACLFKKK